MGTTKRGFNAAIRLILAALVCLFAAWSDDSTPLFSRTLGGSGQNDIITAIALDSSGNIVVAGNAVSPDLPVTDGSSNPGTQFSVSNDHGATWHPLSNLPHGAASTFAFDPGSPGTVYAGGSDGVFKSTDGGASWAATSLTAYTASLAIDPKRRQIIFAGTNRGIFKSTDAGATWSPVSNGIDTIGGKFSPDYIAIDPFHPDTIYTHVFNADLRSFDGGLTWKSYVLPSTVTGNHPVKVTFDLSQPGTIYAAGVGGLFRSSDNGLNWTQLNQPFPFSDSIVTVPAAPGSVWIQRGGSVYRSDDQGVTFTPVLSRFSDGGLSVDPSNTSVVLTDLYRTPNNGATVQYFGLGRRAVQILFDSNASGRAIALAHPASAVFLAKLDPAGENILWMRYFGGMGDNTVTSMAIDPGGNMYLAGQTTSSDFPVTSGTFGPAPPESNAIPLAQNSFAAKFDSNGKLVYSTFLSSGAASAIATDSKGNAIVTGDGCFLTKISADATKTVFSTQLSNASLCTGVAIDRFDNLVVVGTTNSPYLPWTGDGIQTKLAGPGDAVIARFGADGTLLYASYFGGSDADGASAVSLDAAGNIYLAGTTFSKDFPVTPDAYQSQLGAGCPTSFNAILTRAAGVPNSVWDDLFVVKLDPTARSVLYSTYLGGTCQDESKSASVDSNGNVWISGASNSSDFPQIWPIFTPAGGNSYYGFIAKAASSGTWLWRSSLLPAYMGTSPVVVADRSGNAYVGGAATALMKIGPQ